MCGIYAAFGTTERIEQLAESKDYQEIQHRGPDNTQTIQTDHALLGFHRLAIMDQSRLGDQPMVDYSTNRILMCNGEIYNHKELGQGKDGASVYTSHSDCEAWFHVMSTLDVSQAMNAMDGVFAMIMWDRKTHTITVGRDPVGVRPLFCYLSKDLMVFSSEAKALKRFGKEVQAFPHGSYAQFQMWEKPMEVKSQQLGHENLLPQPGQCYEWQLRPYWRCFNPMYSLIDSTHPYEVIRSKLTAAVRKRMMSDRPIGCLLSGGLDSSLVTALVQSMTKQPVHTFAIGMEGSTDLAAAQKVADYIGTVHHSVVVQEKDFLEALPDVIKATETYDVTTIRASTGMYLLSKYIAQKTDIKVIFSGEGADEICQGYIYFHRQPTTIHGDMESRRLITDLMFFDVLRADRTTAAWGLELRVPFLDKDFLKTYLSIDAQQRQPQAGVEKHLLRSAFDEQSTHQRPLIPKEILWRAKEAFSDGVSAQKRSWHRIIQEEVENKVTDVELKQAYKVFPFNTPETKEAYWFRHMFETYYPHMSHLIPYPWLPKWMGEIKDPSARELVHYK